MLTQVKLINVTLNTALDHCQSSGSWPPTVTTPLTWTAGMHSLQLHSTHYCLSFFLSLFFFRRRLVLQHSGWYWQRRRLCAWQRKCYNGAEFEPQRSRIPNFASFCELETAKILLQASPSRSDDWGLSLSFCIRVLIVNSFVFVFLFLLILCLSFAVWVLLSNVEHWLCLVGGCSHRPGLAHGWRTHIMEPLP